MTLEELMAGETFSVGAGAQLQMVVTGLCDDSRLLKPGEIFFAVPGRRHDGNAFIDAALKAGAVAVVVEEGVNGFPKLVKVPCVRLAMARMAARWNGNPSHRLSVIGITGTNGKTTSAFLVRSIWDRLEIPSAVLGTIENRIGNTSFESPLTTSGALVLQAQFKEIAAAGVSHVAMEVSSIALDQYRTSGTRFKAALFTNLTQDHLDYHGTIDSYFESKRRLFQEYELESAAINVDDPWGQKLLDTLPLTVRPVRFGFGVMADVRASRPSYSLNGFKATVSHAGRDYHLESSLIGRHNLMNCLGVLALCDSMRVSFESAVSALSAAKGAPGRLERVAAEKHRPQIFVDYAHTPDALEKVLTALRSLRDGEKAQGRIITVFGCGGDRDKGKRPLMGSVVSSLSDVAIVTSDNPRGENPESIIDEIVSGVSGPKGAWLRESNRSEAIRQALSIAGPSDIVIVAGKGHETYQIIGSEKLPFDDRRVIRDYYQEA